MEACEIIAAMESLAPLKLSAEFVKTYGGYDNSGIIIPMPKNVTGVVFSLDLTKKAVERAKKIGANLIITHHPAIYNPLKKLEEDSALFASAKNGLGVVSYHLNLDCAKRGTDYCLAVAAGAKTRRILMPLSSPETGYGSFYTIPETSVFCLAEKLKKELNAEKVSVYGGDKKVSRIASFCGAGFDEEGLELIGDAEVCISSDIPHHILLAASERGVSVINLTHYASEFYGFKKFAEELIKNLKLTNGEIVLDELFL